MSAPSSASSSGSAPPTWEDVLASFEATADHAESLLGGDQVDVPVAAVAYDLWRLELPALPGELRPRAQAIQQRQALLAGQLSASMRTVRRHQELADQHARPRRAAYVDQLV